jgi:hypothetical protein
LRKILYQQQWLNVIVALLLGCSDSLCAAESPKSDVSTKPIKIKLKDSDRVFTIPRNYFSPQEANEPDEEELEYFGFTLFLPNFEGYSPATARFYAPEHFPPIAREAYYNSVYVLRVEEVSKFDTRNGKQTPLPPNAWGDPKAMFDAVSKGYELLREDYGLKCYGHKSWEGKGNQFPCIGTRSNGELIFMWASDPPESGMSPYICDVVYYSEQQQLYINYRYSRRNIAKWRELDDAVWAKINAWRVR